MKDSKQKRSDKNVKEREIEKEEEEGEKLSERIKPTKSFQHPSLKWQIREKGRKKSEKETETESLSRYFFVCFILH